MEILANIGAVVAVLAGTFVLCNFLRWFLGIRRLEEKLDAIHSELHALRDDESGKRGEMVREYRELLKESRSAEGLDQS